MTQTTWKQDILKLSFRTAETLARRNKGGPTETQTQGRISMEKCQSRISSSLTRVEPMQHVHADFTEYSVVSLKTYRHE